MKTLQVELNSTAESYAKLVLAVGQHDADYVDAFYGPEAWKQEAMSAKIPLETIRTHAAALTKELERIDVQHLEEIVQLRHQYLLKQVQSMIARTDLLGGARMTFDEESKALYDAVAPQLSEQHFQRVLRELGTFLPGSGPVHDRYESYKRNFVIPRERLARVFETAIQESRSRTRKHIPLPHHESFTVEYVTNKSWSGYNWYKGRSHSLIQVNTDLPIFIDRAIDLASHEGYPGHHVYNALLEENMVNRRKWMEFTVYPLFSPQSMIAEGTANYGIEIAFPSEERVAFERDVLFPEAGLDGQEAEMYYRVHELFLKLAYAGNEAARRYLNGEIDREGAVDWLVRYALMSPERARQRTKFFDQYRSYVINYNLGQDLVKNYIERRGGTPDNPDKRWTEFHALISSPRLPSGLVKPQPSA
jgi:hypothetical protein